MRYHIDTIPLWDSMRENTCCLCGLSTHLEESEVTRFLGGSVMDPDTRVRVNERGFCQRHQRLLYERQNRLGHALMMQSHLHETRQEVLKALETIAQDSSGGLFKKKKGGARQEAIEKLQTMSCSCILCDSMEENLQRYRYTLLHLYRTDTAFRKEYQKKGLCLRCLPPVLKMAQEEYSEADFVSLVRDSMQALSDSTAQDEKDIYAFTLLFDYRNAGKTLEGSKGALERTVNRLRGECLEEPR